MIYANFEEKEMRPLSKNGSYLEIIVTTYPMPIFIKKKQHIVKTLAATLNKSKKRKRFFLFLDLKRHRYAPITSVA
jgi:hypothetical protein